MKIIIGPYLNYWGPYQIFGLLTKVGFSKETTDHWAENAPEWFNKVCLWVETKRKVKRKIIIHNYDTWGMDHTLAYIIVPMLKQLKATKHGIPTQMFKDGDGTDKWGNPSEAAFKIAELRWDDTLDKMIWSFEQINDPDEGLEQFKIRDNYDWAGYKNYQKKIQEGFELFGLHYQSLWD